MPSEWLIRYLIASAFFLAAFALLRGVLWLLGIDWPAGSYRRSPPSAFRSVKNFLQNSQKQCLTGVRTYDNIHAALDM